MASKPRIHGNVPPSGVRSRIPSEFHGVLDESLLPARSYTVISFPGMRGASSSIVDSKTLERALRKRPPTSGGVLVVAHGFTAEAREMLASLDAVYFFTSDFHWCDESWASIRDK